MKPIYIFFENTFACFISEPSPSNSFSECHPPPPPPTIFLLFLCHSFLCDLKWTHVKVETKRPWKRSLLQTRFWTWTVRILCHWNTTVSVRSLCQCEAPIRGPNITSYIHEFNAILLFIKGGNVNEIIMFDHFIAEHGAECDALWRANELNSGSDRRHYRPQCSIIFSIRPENNSFLTLTACVKPYLFISRTVKLLLFFFFFKQYRRYQHNWKVGRIYG